METMHQKYLNFFKNVYLTTCIVLLFFQSTPCNAWYSSLNNREHTFAIVLFTCIEHKIIIMFVYSLILFIKTISTKTTNIC